MLRGSRSLHAALNVRRLGSAAAATTGSWAPAAAMLTQQQRPSAPVSISGLWSARRCVGTTEIANRPKIDYGPPEPRGQPPREARGRNPVYIVEPKAKRGSFRRFLGVAGDVRWLLMLSVGVLGVYTVAVLAIPHCFGDLMDHAGRGEMPWRASWRLIAWVLLAGFANFARVWLTSTAAEHVVTDLRKRVFRAVIKHEAAFFDTAEQRSGALTQRITMDTNVVGSALTEGLTNGLRNAAQAAGAIAMMVYYSWPLTSVVCVFLPPLALMGGQYGKLIRRLQAKRQDAVANMGAVAEERILNVRMIKAFASEEQEAVFFNKYADRIRTVGKQMTLWNAYYVCFFHSCGYLALYAIVWAGSLMVSMSQLSSGLLVSYLIYTVYAGVGLIGTVNLVSEINKGYGASIRLFELIDKATEITAIEKQAKRHKLPLCEGRFKFDNVGFAYPSRPDQTIFRDLHLEINPGTCVAVVGSSGSGKSSLASLLLKLYEPSTGRVTLDGHDLAGLDSTWLRSVVGYVPQEPVLFAGTVAENIAYGVPNRQWGDKLDDWTRDAVIAAAKKANAHDFIMGLPSGYDTYVGEGGRALSGGQKQRVAIARALVRSPNLLVLDEATSALDSESEAVVQAAIEKLVMAAKRGEDDGPATAGRNQVEGGDAQTTQEQHPQPKSRRAVLMFAHRLSMIRQADVIVLLDQGRVADQGTYDHMLKNPAFRILVGVDSQGRVDTSKPDLTAAHARVAHHLEGLDVPLVDATARARRLKQQQQELSTTGAAGSAPQASVEGATLPRVDFDRDVAGKTKPIPDLKKKDDDGA